MKMITSEWREFQDRGARMRMCVKYGFDTAFAEKHRQEPRFSMTCDIEEKARNGRWIDVGGGAAHDEIARHFPELAPLVRWHLCGAETGPMHYLANLYWLDTAAGRVEPSKYGPEPMSAFKSTIVYGALDVDRAFDLDTRPAASLDREIIEEWLKARLPALVTKMRDELRAAGVM